MSKKIKRSEGLHPLATMIAGAFAAIASGAAKGAIHAAIAASKQQQPKPAAKKPPPPDIIDIEYEEIK